MRIAVFASGNGSNFQALVDAQRDNHLTYDVVCLIVDKRDIIAINRAKKLNIPYRIFIPNDYESKQTYEEAIVTYLSDKEIDMIGLAGYMRIVGKTLLHTYPDKIINIHPSLLPRFPGRHGIVDAYEADVHETGVTIHYVDEGIDTGKIIAQKSLTIGYNESLESLEERIHKIEHQLYPQVVQQLATAFEEE